MDDSFGGMSADEFFLGYDAMIPEDDPDSINYDPREHDESNIGRGTFYSGGGGGCCCVALLLVLILVIFFI